MDRRLFILGSALSLTELGFTCTKPKEQKTVEQQFRAQSYDSFLGLVNISVNPVSNINYGRYVLRPDLKKIEQIQKGNTLMDKNHILDPYTLRTQLLRSQSGIFEFNYTLEAKTKRQNAILPLSSSILEQTDELTINWQDVQFTTGTITLKDTRKYLLFGFSDDNEQ